MSYKIILNEKQHFDLKRAIRTESSIKIYKRLQAVYMQSKGVMKKDIAEILDVTQNTITTWLKIYMTGGVNELTKLHYEGRRESKLDPYKEKIQEYVSENHPITVSQIQTWLFSTYSLDVEHSWLYRYCKENTLIPAGQ